MNARAADYECQIEGCHEPALSYPYEVGELTLLVRLCRRHEHDLVQMERAAASSEAVTS